MHRPLGRVRSGLICLVLPLLLAACASGDRRHDSAARWSAPETRESSTVPVGVAKPPEARAVPVPARTTATKPQRPAAEAPAGPHAAEPQTETAPEPEAPKVAAEDPEPVRKPAVRGARPRAAKPARPATVARPAVPAPGALAIGPLPEVAPRLLLGFQDDASFRWSPARQELLDQAATAGATLIRTTVNWSEIAARRPARPADSFDPAYRFDNTDELVRNAQQRGVQLLLTIWGTPTWANGGAGHNHAPAKAADLAAFARAVADRYSGRHAGYPFVGHYTVWNEPNLAQFLAPQFDAAGVAVAPAIYARLYRAAYAGIKAGNPEALVAIGETSPRGRDVPTTRHVQQSVSPGRFAQLLSRVRPGLEFDAWAHHPYPTAPNLPPTQVARWPNVTLSELPRFEAALRAWFGRADVPIWITEYAYQTNPPYRFGVPPARQAAYLTRAMKMLAAQPWVRLVVWFTFRDSPGNPWKSGLTTADGTRKPALAAFAATERELAARNATVAVSSRSAVQALTLPAQRITYYSGAGAAVGLVYRVLLDGRVVSKGEAAAALERDGTVVLRLPFRPRAGLRYTVQVDGSDVHGNQLEESLTLVAS